MDLIHTKTAKTVASGHVFWAQNIRKMRLRPELRPDPAGGAYGARPDPSWI